MTQLAIDFSLHKRENNKHSEAILKKQGKRLSKNCERLYEALKAGKRLTGAIIVSEYGMLEYRRRILDLKEAGIDIKETLLENGCKSWFL